MERVFGIEAGTPFGVMGRTDCLLLAVPLEAVEALVNVAFFMVKSELYFRTNGE